MAWKCFERNSSAQGLLLFYWKCFSQVCSRKRVLKSLWLKWQMEWKKRCGPKFYFEKCFRFGQLLSICMPSDVSLQVYFGMLGRLHLTLTYHLWLDVSSGWEKKQQNTLLCVKKCKRRCEIELSLVVQDNCKVCLDMECPTIKSNYGLPISGFLRVFTTSIKIN